MGENGLLTEETAAMRSSTTSNTNAINATAGGIIIAGINKAVATSRSSTRGRSSPPYVLSGVMACGIPQGLHGDGRFLALDTFAIIVSCEAGHA